MRNLPLLSCLVESYGYNFIHLRFSALCCGCHRAFGSRQIKCTCSSHPQPGHSAPQPPLRTDPEVLVVFLVGQGRERHLVINQLIPPNRFFHTYKVIQAAFEHWHFKHVLFGSLFNSLPFVMSVRLGCEGAWMY